MEHTRLILLTNEFSYSRRYKLPISEMRDSSPMSLKILTKLGLVVVTGILCLYPGLVVAEEVWKCGEVYTTTFKEKAGCERAGATESCGNGGERYIAPRKSSEAAQDMTCPVGASSDSSFERVRNQIDTALLGTRKWIDETTNFGKNRRKISKQASKLDDIFSCFSSDRNVTRCSILDFVNSIENTLSASQQALE